MNNNLKIKEGFIHDQRRVSYLNAIYNTIYRGKSILIEGGYSAGKSRFLELIKPPNLQVVKLESLDKTHQLLAAILQQLKYDALPAYHMMSQHLKMISEINDFIIIVDETNDLDKRVWPYFKRIMDAQIPIIFAGLPKVRTYLTHEHPDILSRLKILQLFPIRIEDFIRDYEDFESEALEQIYASAGGDMRRFKEICADCRDKASELKQKVVNVNLALSFLKDFQPSIFN